MLSNLDHETLKFFHLLGAVIFLGNIIVTAVWKVLADRTREPAVVGFSQSLVTITDFAFTAVGVVVIFVTGQLLALQYGGASGEGWLIYGRLMFYLSGAIWVLILIPVQIMQARLARSFRHGGPIPARYWRLSRVWAVTGAIATLAPIVTLNLMVMKPF